MPTPINKPRYKQDPQIKGNPFMAEPLGDEQYRVRSASAERTYTVDLAAQTCSCDARKVWCWHMEAAHLRADLEPTITACRTRYCNWRLAELQAEDERLAALLAAEDSYLIRAQYDVVADYIGQLCTPLEAA
jgi:hypothetical protein